MRFSERMGIVKASNIIQKDDMNDDLRTDLFNVFYLFTQKDSEFFNSKMQKILYFDFFKKPVSDALSYYFYGEIKYFIENSEWNYVYDLIECVVETIKHHKLTSQSIDDLIGDLNNVLKRNNSAYRFVGTQIACITDDTEIKEIETAQENPHSNVQTHINTALGFLSDRQNPDYRNSIKESISAVEALCREITGESTLDKALPALVKKGVEIPNMLRKSFEHFYHFTNDKNGIRHALMDEEQIGFEEAKYMLVLCSAFVNYLQAKLA